MLLDTQCATACGHPASSARVVSPAASTPLHPAGYLGIPWEGSIASQLQGSIATGLHDYVAHACMLLCGMGGEGDNTLAAAAFTTIHDMQSAMRCDWGRWGSVMRAVVRAH
jgi:hypothetical protein